MFVASAITHMALPLGEVGIQRLPNEEAVVAALRENLRDRGFYFFPAMADGATAEQQQRWAEAYRRGPTGILVYRPQGSEPLSAGQFATECFSNILVALVAAWLLAQTGLASFAARVLFVAALGLVASLAIDVSQWNWYGFPGDFMLASMADQVISLAAAGLAMGRLVKL